MELLDAHLQDLLHDLSVPHVPQLVLLPAPAVPRELHHVAAHLLLRGPGVGLSPGGAPGLSHPGAPIWENSENSHLTIIEVVKLISITICLG